jgi:hypothetical protein
MYRARALCAIYIVRDAFVKQIAYPTYFQVLLLLLNGSYLNNHGLQRYSSPVFQSADINITKSTPRDGILATRGEIEERAHVRATTMAEVSDDFGRGLSILQVRGIMLQEQRISHHDAANYSCHIPI